MTTLALKPAFPMRSKSSGSQRDDRIQPARKTLHRKAWQAVALTVGATALAFFSVSAPMIGNPARRLFALDATPTIATEDAIHDSSQQALELTPTMLGPAITDDLFSLAEVTPVVDLFVLWMPELEIRAVPPG